MSHLKKLRFVVMSLLGAAICAWTAQQHVKGVDAASGAVEQPRVSYRVFAPIMSGNLLLFPVVDSRREPASTFLTLDDGIKSGEVEVTEVGSVRGMVRQRPTQGRIDDGVLRARPQSDRGDQVNTLVLVNNSQKPLLLLAGEIVTGGKQDRIIAKDRIVPADGKPIDLNVFCIEPGRWTEATPTFTSSSKSPAKGMMVQPAVRAKAMVDKNQQEVWNSVHRSITSAMQAAGPSYSGSVGDTPFTTNLGTTSYARAMQNSALSAKVDEAAAPVMKAREQVLKKLHEEHAVGVVVAVGGEIVWADIFSSADLFSRYWTKLVRSYAAEGLGTSGFHSTPNMVDAQRFLDAPAGGGETSIGDVGVYRYRELHSGSTETFVLESLLPGTDYDVHVSKVKLRGEVGQIDQPFVYR